MHILRKYKYKYKYNRVEVQLVRRHSTLPTVCLSILVRSVVCNAGSTSRYTVQHSVRFRTLEGRTQSPQLRIVAIPISDPTNIHGWNISAGRRTFINIIVKILRHHQRPSASCTGGKCPLVPILAKDCSQIMLHHPFSLRFGSISHILVTRHYRNRYFQLHKRKLRRLAGRGGDKEERSCCSSCCECVLDSSTLTSSTCR